MLGVVGAGFDERGKVANPIELVAGRRHGAAAELFEVQPLMGGVLESRNRG